MLTSTLIKIPLRDAREAQGLTVAELAEASGVCATSIHRIEGATSPYGIHEDTAARLSRALGKRVEDIRWPRSLSQRGRTPGTGTALKLSAPGIPRICPQCHIEQPRFGDCNFCN